MTNHCALSTAHNPGWLFRVSIIWESRWDTLSAEEIEKINIILKNIQNIPNESTAELTECSELEKNAINQDLRRRRRKLGTFVRTSKPSSSLPSSQPSDPTLPPVPDPWKGPWTLMQNIQVPVIKIVEESDWIGKYVRLQAGIYAGKLGRVMSCGLNGLSCCVYILW